MVKRFLVCLMALVFCVGGAAFAEEAPAQEPSFADAFDAEAINEEAWKIIVSEENGSYWKIDDGKLQGGINAYADGYLWYANETYTDVAIECDVMLESGNAVSFIARMPESAGGEGYQLFFDQWDGLKICKRPYEVLLNRGALSVGVWYHVRFTVQGTTLTADITDIAQDLSFSISCEDATYADAGYVGLCVFGMGTVAHIDNLAVYDLSK